MLNSISKIFALCLFILGISLETLAQDDQLKTGQETATGLSEDSVEVEKPWPLNKKGEPKGSEFFVISAIRLGADMRPLMQSAFIDGMNAYTLYGDIMIRNAYYITAEYGQMDRTRENPESNYFKYRSNGSFYRVGVEYNVMKRSSETSGLSFGFKYANSTFDQSADYYSTGNGYWEEGATLKHLTEKNVNVDWFEVTVAIKVLLVKNFIADFGFAYTIKKDFPPTAITKNDIPGWYFNKDDRSRLNFQFRLLYRIPLMRMYTLSRPPKKF